MAADQQSGVVRSLDAQYWVLAPLKSFEFTICMAAFCGSGRSQCTTWHIHCTQRAFTKQAAWQHPCALSGGRRCAIKSAHRHCQQLCACAASGVVHIQAAGYIGTLCVTPSLNQRSAVAAPSP